MAWTLCFALLTPHRPSRALTPPPLFAAWQASPGPGPSGSGLRVEQGGREGPGARTAHPGEPGPRARGSSASASSKRPAGHELEPRPAAAGMRTVARGRAHLRGLKTRVEARCGPQSQPDAERGPGSGTGLPGGSASAERPGEAPGRGVGCASGEPPARHRRGLRNPQRGRLERPRGAGCWQGLRGLPLDPQPTAPPGSEAPRKQKQKQKSATGGRPRARGEAAWAAGAPGLPARRSPRPRTGGPSSWALSLSRGTTPGDRQRPPAPVPVVLLPPPGTSRLGK